MLRARRLFDVVITDIELPSGLGGLELTQLVKRDHQRRRHRDDRLQPATIPTRTPSVSARATS
ncbi:MAG: hypothetical protein MZV70_49355 [Desulfobacterales bacterium]|nr:hypothetical protein [Desulfobacterales bacterium]